MTRGHTLKEIKVCPLCFFIGALSIFFLRNSSILGFAMWYRFTLLNNSKMIRLHAFFYIVFSNKKYLTNLKKYLNILKKKTKENI